jgi:hypothetical protein
MNLVEDVILQLALYPGELIQPQGSKANDNKKDHLMNSNYVPSIVLVVLCALLLVPITLFCPSENDLKGR